MTSRYAKHVTSSGGQRPAATRCAAPDGCRGRAPAFTILEVLIALAIFALAAVVLGTSYLNVLNAYSSVAERARFEDDLRFARTFVLTEPVRDEVEKGGEFTSQGSHRVAWKVGIESTDTADLYLVTFDCEISGPDLPKPEVVTQKFRLLRPTWDKNGERQTLRAADRDRILKIQGEAP